MGRKSTEYSLRVFPFFMLVTLLAIPFWLLGSFTHIMLLPGLPIAALAAFSPSVASLILVHRRGGRKAVGEFVKTFFSVNSAKTRWYALSIIIMPIVGVLVFGIQRLVGVNVPDPSFNFMSVIMLCAIFFTSAVGEELGWTGYATAPMIKRFGLLATGLALGLFWAIFHYIGLAQADRGIEWAAWWTLGTVAMRMIMVWLYSSSGNFAIMAILFHMASNVVWQLYPINGTFYDPRLQGIILAIIALIIVAFAKPIQNLASK